MKKNLNNNNLLIALALGVCFGLASWLIFDNMVIGISTGIVLGCTTYIVNN